MLCICMLYLWSIDRSLDQESLKLSKIIATALLVLLALTVAGCTKKVEPIRVKCPACGYEFDVQPEG